MIHGNHILIELYGFELYGFIEYVWFLCHIAHTYIYIYIYIVSSNRLYQICVSWLELQTRISPWAIRNAVRQSSDAASQDWKVGCFLEFCECVASLVFLNMEDPKTMGTPHLGKHPFGMIPNRSIFNIYIYIRTGQASERVSIINILIQYVWQDKLKHLKLASNDPRMIHNDPEWWLIRIWSTGNIT